MGTTASALLGGLEFLWGEHSPFVMGEVILLGAMGFYLVAWLLVGWDRHKAAGGPKHEPPAGYSPAALRYLWSIVDCPIGYVVGCFTTVVVGLAGVVEGTKPRRASSAWRCVKRRDMASRHAHHGRRNSWHLQKG